MNVVIERVGPEDAERVMAIRLRALRDAPDAFWVTLEEEATGGAFRWRDTLELGDRAVFLAISGGANIGLALGAPHWDYPGDAVLAAMWVAPDARGTGVGEALIRAVTQWARDAGHRALRLDVSDTNEPAIRLYARMGFFPTGAVSAFRPPREHITEHEQKLDLASETG
jgi:GNAT superfamily N-acetyltransferase